MRFNIIVSTLLLIIPLTLYGEFSFNEENVTAYDLAELSCQLSCEKERALAAQQAPTPILPIEKYAMCIRGCVERIVGKEYAAFHQNPKSGDDMFMIMLLMGGFGGGYNDSLKDVSNYFYSGLPPALDTSIPKEEKKKEEDK